MTKLVIPPLYIVMPYRTQMESRCFRSHEYAWIGERSQDFADLAPSQTMKSGEGNEALSYHPSQYNPIEVKAGVQFENIFSGNSTLEIYRLR